MMEVSTLVTKQGNGLPNGWKPAKLGDICEISMGTSPRGHTYNRDGIGELLLNGPTEFGPRHPAAVQWTTKPSRFAEAGDILFCVRGATTGRKNVADQRYCIGRGLAAIRGRDGLADTDFLWYVLDVVTNELVGRAAGSTFVNLPGAELKRFQVPLPPLAEQKRIAGILKEQLAAVERARAAAEAQLDAAKALPAAYLRDVFSQLQHCKTVKLSAIASRGITYGIVLTGDHCPDGVPTVRGGDVKGFAIERELLKRVEPHISEQFSRTLLRGDEVLLVIRGYPGNVAVVAPDLVGCNVAREIAVIAVTENWSRPYVQYAIASPTVQQSILDKTQGAAQKGINLSDVANLEIPEISVSEQTSLTNRLSELLDGTGKVLADIKAQLRTIEALPSALLRAAFQGQL